jgi:putative oxidoreductase
MFALLHQARGLLDTTRRVDFIAPLLLRLYLAPIFWMAGTKKFASFDSTVAWFGNPDWGLGLPFPTLLAFLAAATETAGAVLLVLGLGVRLISVPLIVTMLVAMATVHWQHGWLAIAEGAGSLFANARTIGAVERLDVAKDILREHGDYQWLTEHGSLVILNNGIEFAATYLIMLVALFFIGAGRWLSVDDWIGRRLDRLSPAARNGAPARAGARGGAPTTPRMAA